MIGMAYLPIPKKTITCKCGHTLIYVRTDGIREISGTIKEDDFGTYIKCPICGRKTYFG